MAEGRSVEKGIVPTIIVLIRFTTWRCGKLERSIIGDLHRKKELCGNPQIRVTDMLRTSKLKGKKRSEFLDAVRRLEKRRIVRVMEPPC